MHLENIWGSLGVLAQDPEAYFKGGVAVSCLISEQDIEKMIELRVQARLEKKLGRVGSNQRLS